MATSSESSPKKPAKAPAVAKATKPVAVPRTKTADQPAVAAGAPAIARLAMPDKGLILKAVGALAGLVIVLLIIFGVLVYHYKSDSPVVQAVARIVPYPAERVNGAFVSYQEYLFQLNTYKSYLSSKSNSTGQTPVNFNSAAGKAQLAQVKTQVMGMLTSDEVVRQLAAKRKLTISQKDITAEVDALAKQAGGTSALDKVLASVYGWSENDLRHQLAFQLLQQKLQQSLTNDATLNAQAKATAESVLKQINAGGDFATLAKKYSQDTATAANGGELGSFGKSSGLNTTFVNAAFALNPGQVSGVVKTADGYEIIKLNSKTGDQVDASHILIEPINFTNYLGQQVQQAKVSKYIKV